MTITENDCVETFVQQVEVFTDPVFTASADTMRSCANLNGFFHGTSTSEYVVNYLWDFGDGSTSTATSPTHQYTTPGVYDVKVVMTTDDGCIALDSIVYNNLITISPPPVPGFIFSNTQLDLLNPNTSIFSTATNAVECHYFLSDGGSSDNCDFDYSFFESGSITITQQVTSADGCVAEIVGTIVINGFAFYAPIAFSPNEDDLNDVWLPRVIGATKYSLSIFNRWGDKIFETKDAKMPWTGDAYASEYYAQDGIYNYIVRVDDLLGLPHEFIGHIVLIR